jgi:hypothetical protein
MARLALLELPAATPADAKAPTAPKTTALIMIVCLFIVALPSEVSVLIFLSLRVRMHRGIGVTPRPT